MRELLVIDQWQEHAIAVGCLDVAPEPGPAPSKNLAALVDRVSVSLGADPADVRGASRKGPIVKVRRIVMAEAMDAGFSSVAVGRELGGRDHSTVLAGVKRLHPYRGGE